VPLLATGAFQRRNFALARAAAEAYLREPGVHGLAAIEGVAHEGDAHERAVRDAAARTAVPGRLQVIDEDPLTVLDGAHNPDAVAALIESLPEVLGDRPTALVLGVLEDKDAASMLASLLGHCERAWFTAPPSDRALSPAALQSLARQLGFDAVSCEPEPGHALTQARRWAGRRAGAVLATGSVYLVGDLLGGFQQRRVQGGSLEDGALDEVGTLRGQTALGRRLGR
jgi:dihydrofolate synthase/folylpolyglutamate synthase